MNKRILVIDDDSSLAKLVEVVLKKDYEVVVSHSVEEGVHLLDNLPVDGVICDLNLPGRSGFEFLDTVRRDMQDEWLPIIVLSGKEKSEDRIRCFEKGADDYLMKPFNPVELRLRLARLLKRAELQGMKVHVA